MKKPKRVPLKKGKGKGKAVGEGGRSERSSPTRPARKSALERIPVRGAQRSKVKPRAAVETRASATDVAETQVLAVVALEAAIDKHALAPVLIDVSAMGSYTDFIGIVSGRSDRQVDAIAENICQTLKLRGRHLFGREGTGNGRWTLLDFGSFVIHVFYHPVREFYDLESLWIEAPRVKLDVPAEATLPQADALYGAL